MPPIPKLPATWVAILGVLAVALTAIQPHLSGAWQAIVGVVLTALTILGVGATNVAIKAHAAAVRDAAREEATR